jgi:hypothetical protein
MRLCRQLIHIYVHIYNQQTSQDWQQKEDELVMHKEQVIYVYNVNFIKYTGIKGYLSLKGSQTLRMLSSSA